MKNVSWSAVGAIAGAISALVAIIALGPAYCNEAEPAIQQAQDVHIDNSVQGSGQSANTSTVGDGNVVEGRNIEGDHNAVVNGDINAPAAVGRNNKVTVQHVDQVTEQEE